MEKLANNLIKRIIRTTSCKIIIFLLFLTPSINFAQDTSLENGKKYILGGIEVTGVQSYNEQTVKTFTGLRVGQEITIPGEEISAVIKKLWGLELFSDVKFYQQKIEGCLLYTSPSPRDS